MNVMSKKPEVSVVIPLYNKESTVERAIRSVLAQTFQDFELIVINDGSTDRGPEVVAAIEDPRIRLLHQSNAGVSAARNRGIDMANAGLVAFLDADDEWYAGFLSAITDLHQRFPLAGLYATRYEITDGSNHSPVPSRARGIPAPPWSGIIPNFYKTTVGMVFTSAAVVKREAAIEAGGFDTALHIGEDLEMWFRIARDHPVAFSSVVAVLWHTEASDPSRKVVYPREVMASSMWQSMLKMEREGLLTDRLKSLMMNYVGRHELGIARWLCGAGCSKEALEVLVSWRRRYGFSPKWLCVYIYAFLRRLVGTIDLWSNRK